MTENYLHIDARMADCIRTHLLPRAVIVDQRRVVPSLLRRGDEAVTLSRREDTVEDKGEAPLGDVSAVWQRDVLLRNSIIIRTTRGGGGGGSYLPPLLFILPW